MKKLFFTAFMMLFAAGFVFAADKETPASIYEKVIGNSYIGKYKSIIIDKELSSSEMPAGMIVKSRTYYADNKFREETQTTDPGGQTMNIVTIFTSSDTYISYDAGESFFSIGISLLDQISANIKNIEPFTSMAVINEAEETVNGSKCYVIEDSGGGFNRKFYVEKKTYNLIKSIVSSDDVTVITEMSDYKKVNKYLAPFSMKISFQQKTDGKQSIESAVKITSIQFNPSINGNMFIPKNVTPLPDIPGMENIKDMIESLF